MRDGKGVVSSCISARRWRHTAAPAGKKTEKKKRGRGETQQRASETEREKCLAVWGSLNARIYDVHIEIY
jgi:hypothetical protein